MAPGRVSRPVLRARFVIEAAAGATDRWRLRVGDSLEVIVAEGRNEGAEMRGPK
jgi:uncharacterized membrane protein (UPF0127 family)